MKDRLFLMLFLIALVGCSDSGDFQDETDNPATELSYLNTGLPVVYINTHSGAEVASKDNYEWGTIEICAADGSVALPMQNFQIHGRGNSSWYTFTKKRSYTLKLNDKADILGMPADKKWVLIANYRDKTLLRNSVAWWLSDKLDALKWTPRYKFVELVLNGTHRGTYQLAEQVKISANRVNINEMSPYDRTAEACSGGYIIELDRGVNTDQWEWVMPYMHGDVHKLSIKEPKIEDGNEQQRQYVYDYLMNIDRMFGADSCLREVMEKYIDMPSWAAQWLVFEISGTPEPNGPNSWYTYKDKNDDKWYCGPAWDFDYKSFIPATASKWVNSGVIYMPEMLAYRPFREVLKSQWSVIEPLLPELISFVEQQRDFLARSAVLNWTIHDRNLIDDNRTENGDEFLPSDTAVVLMIDYLRLKWDFISKNIDGI